MRSVRLFVEVLGAGLAVLLPVAAAAQTPAQAAPSAPPVVAGWSDAGFFLQSANGDYRLNLGMVAQEDGRFSLDTPTPITNTFTLRKIRPTFTGRLARYFDFKVMPDFGNGTAVVQDAYFDIRFSPKFRVRTGKDKTPFGYEILIGDANLFFPERSLASSLAPNRDIGVQVQGDLSPKLYYAAGVVNGIPDGTSTTTELDTNNGKDLAGRIVVQPFRTGSAKPGALTGLGFQVGGTHGKQTGPPPSFKTSVGQTYFSYGSTVSAGGVRNRVSPSVFYYFKAFGAFAEYFRSTQGVVKSAVQTDVANTAWDITAVFDPTGEPASTAGLRPTSPFEPPAGKWGGLQLVARYTELHVDPVVFAAGLNATGASEKAKSFTVGANWFPAAVIKYYLTYERTTFHSGAVRPPENVILFRTQLAF